MVKFKKENSAAVRQVKEKLRALRDYRDKPDEELQTKAVELISKEKMKEMYFNYLLSGDVDAVDEVVEDAGAFPEGRFSHSGEFHPAHERARDRFHRVARLHVRLLLSPLRDTKLMKGVVGSAARKLQSYGPLHAAVDCGRGKN